MLMLHIATARNIIEKKPIAFTGNLNFFDNGTTYLEHDPESVRFVGKPSKEIDENWDNLLQSKRDRIRITSLCESNVHRSIFLPVRIRSSVQLGSIGS